MVWWMCGVKLSDKVPTSELYALLGMEDISSAIGTKRLRWHGYVCRPSDCIKTIGKLTVEGKKDVAAPE